MNTDLNIFRSRLEDERRRCIKQLEQLHGSVPPIEERRDGSPFGKREEEATEVAEFEKRLILERKIMDLLSKVEYALNKFEKGTYGLCDVCNQPIDPARLEALPNTSFCLNCKANPQPVGSSMVKNIMKGGS